MAEWKTCRERCYLEELASADGKIKVHRRKSSEIPGERILEHAVAVRSELEEEFGEGAFDDVEYTLRTHNRQLGAWYNWDTEEVLIDFPLHRPAELSDVLTLAYSRFILPKDEGRRLHEHFMREACGEVLEAQEELALYNIMKGVGTAWEESYEELSNTVLRELLRHESTHHLEKNLRPPLSMDYIRMRPLTLQEFTEHTVSDMLREGFASLVGYDYEVIIPPAVGGVFRERLEKLFQRAATMPEASYGKYISGLDPAVLDFAGEYLAGTILKAYGEDVIRRCVTEFDQKDIIALHFYACAESGMTPLFDLSMFPYYD